MNTLRIATVIAISFVLSACSEGQAFLDDATRSAAKKTVTPVVKKNFPGLPAEKISDCVIDNAKRDEIFTLAKASVTGGTPETAQTVATIVQRPETVRCFATSGILGGTI